MDTRLPEYALPAPDPALQTALDLSPVGMALLHPSGPGPDADAVDFTYAYLNPAAQSLLRLPARPAHPHQTLFPAPTGLEALRFFREVFAGEPSSREAHVDLPAAGQAQRLRLTAQRSGPWLVVRLEPAAAPTDPAEAAPQGVTPELQAAARALEQARAEAEAHRQQLHRLFMQAPACIATLEGPELVFTLVNPPYQQLVGRRQLLGLPLRQAWPDLAGQPFYDLLEGVYRTGETYYGHEQLASIDRANTGQPEPVYFNFIYQAVRDAAGRITGVTIFAYDITEQVLARRQAQRLNEQLNAANEELAATNEELQATNEELLSSNAELLSTQLELQELNRNLEDRVQQRTEQLQQARAEAERQRAYLERLFMQAPAAICILRGPELVFELINPIYQQFFPERRLLGKPLREALPELADHAAYHSMRRVFDTGEPIWQQALHTPLARTDGGGLEDRYFNYIQQPRYDELGRIDGVLVFGFEVTELVQAQQQAQALQAQLLAAAERRVQERETFYQVFEQTPACIALLRGPEHRFEYVNAAYQQLFPGRRLVGRPLREALPETEAQGFAAWMNNVYRTGETFFGTELLLRVEQPDGQPARDTYFTFTYQAYREQGTVVGISIFAYNVTEQVLARQAREAAARRLRLITDALPVLISYVDQAETYQFVNQAYEGWLQRPAQELLGQPLRAVLGEAAYQRVHGYVKRALAGEEVDFEARLAYPHGVARYVRASYVPDVHDGQVLGAYAVVNDVTALVEARQEAERQRQRLHQLFMEAPAPIVILDGPEFTYELVNPAYQRIFPGRELLGKPLREALPEVTGTFVYEALEQVYRSGETAVFQELPLQLARTEGGPLEDIFWTFTYQARRNAEGAVDGILVFAHEVTDQVRARRVVERSEQYLRQMADNVPTMIWLTDAAGQCQYLNRQWYEYTGQTEAEGLGLGWLEAVHPDDRETTRTTFQDASAHQAPFSLLYRQRRHDGRYRWAIDTGLPRFSRSGQFEGFVGTVFDIHEQKQGELALQRLATQLRTARDEAQALNQELQASNAQLRRTNVDLDSFIYTASHDLKTPITNIEGLVHLLQDHLAAHPALAEELQPLLAMMHTSVERFQRTLEHLSDVTKLQKEHAPPVTEVDLRAVVEDVRQDLLPLIAETRARVDVDVAACPPVSFSAKNLRSVVYNLLSNALKYRHPDRAPHVQVRCRAEAAYTVLEVQDNGLGIQDSRHEEVFTMFRRFHAHVAGSGVGLFMVKRMVENAGGRVEVDSKLGVGSTFRVHFPR